MSHRKNPTLADTLTQYWPDVQWHCVGDPNVYANFVAVVGTMPLYSELLLKQSEAIKLIAISDLSDHCEEVIVAGFESDALGEVHIYDSEIPDQVNLFGAILATTPTAESPSGTAIYYACRNSTTSVKEYHVHTHAQLNVVLQQGAAFKLTMLQKFHMKRLYITALPDDENIEAAVAAVTWDSVE